MVSTVLILGATGRIGQALAEEFAAAGWAVRAQSRKPLSAQLAGRQRIQPVGCDALDRPAMRRAAKGAEVVVHALNPPYTAWSRQAVPLAEAAIDAARHGGAFLMLPGNVYNFGRDLPDLLSASTPERGDTSKARIRIEIEARMAASGLDSVVLRAGDFFGGPQGGGWFDRVLASRLSSGRFVYPGDLDIVHAWAYVPDLARAFVRVAEKRSQLRGAHRLHFEGHSVTGVQLREALEAVTGRRLHRAGVPWGLMRLASPFIPEWREILSMRYLWQRAHRLDDTLLRALIGPPPCTPLADALAAAVADLACAKAPNLAAS